MTEMGKIDIKINRNAALAKKRNDIYNTLLPKDKPKYNNILFLYIDVISHPKFIRAMENSEKFLSKYYNSSEQSFYQMMKYHNFIFFTQQNIIIFAEDNYTENIEYDNFNHENIAMMCDPNFYDPENRFTPYRGHIQ